MAYNAFRGQYAFLSNFYESRITLPNAKNPDRPYGFRCAEAAFQAAKLDPANPDTPALLEKFETMDGIAAKREGHRIPLRMDWEKKKIGFMLYILRIKFASGTRLAEKLLATGDMKLKEENTHGDRFWGTVDGIGENRLGILLMQVRDELRGSQ